MAAGPCGRRAGFCRLAAAAVLLLAPAPARAETASDISAPGIPVLMIPVDVFARLPAMASPQLSPDGTHVGFLKPEDGRFHLVVRPVDNMKSGREWLDFHEEDARIESFSWVNEERLIFSVSFPGRRGRVPTREYRLLTANLDGSELKGVVRRGRRVYFPQIQDRVIDLLPGDREHILLEQDQRTPGLPHVYRVNVYTMKFKRVVRNTKKVGYWMTDLDGVVRLGVAFAKTVMRIYARGREGGKWRTIVKRDVFGDRKFKPLAFGPGPDLLYVLSDHETDTAGIYEFNTETGKFGRRLFWHPAVDATDIVLSRKRRTVIGARYTLDFPEIAYLDEAALALQKALDQALPETVNRILDQGWDRDRFIVYASKPGLPGRYLLVERPAMTVTTLGSSHPGLDLAGLAAVKKVSYRARDGLTIPAYLTLPRVGPAGKWPLIVYPHGGPTSRTTMAFNPFTQFFASRGYAVFQMNFRGSEGFGRSHMTAGYQQWGLGMQDDIVDGVRWLIGQGLADPDRICIYGASYGGYAALMGVIKTPDLFRCAMSFAGVTDLGLLIRQRKKYKYNDLNAPKYNDDSAGGGLEANSPLFNAGRIRVPVLLVHGGRDRVVAVDHAKKMAAALAKAGKEHELLILEGSGHNLRDGGDRAALMSKIEGFLARHMPAAAPAPAPNPVSAGPEIRRTGAGRRRSRTTAPSG